MKVVNDFHLRPQRTPAATGGGGGAEGGGGSSRIPFAIICGIPRPLYGRRGAREKKRVKTSSFKISINSFQCTSWPARNSSTSSRLTDWLAETPWDRMAKNLQ